MPNSHIQRIGVQKIVFILLMSASLWLALFAVASAEVITSFNADYEIHGDGQVTVTETIEHDFEGASKHGIYRNIRNSHPQPATAWYKDRYVGINLVSVTKNGQPEPYTLESYDGLSVRIGDANRTITGVHTYRIVYRLDGALAEYPEGVEFYWNVTGNEWPVAIQNVAVSVRATPDAELVPVQACYVGTLGASSGCYSNGLNGNIAVFSQDHVLPGQELTIAQRLIIPVPVKVLEKTNLYIFLITGALVWFIGLGIWIYRWRFYYRPAQTVIAQYEPLPDFKPMFTGVLFDNKLDPRDISAGIVYLAQQGFISIRQVTNKVLFLFQNTDYEVTLNLDISKAENEFLKRVLTLLFDGHDGIPGNAIKLSEIKNNTARQITNAKVVKELRKAVIRELVTGGLLEQKLSRDIRSIVLGLSIGGFYVMFEQFITVDLSTILVIFVLISTLVLVIGYRLERRTKKGFEALNYLRGFKDFLSVTEKERYKFHNAPALSPQQFMEYLPYAIAFGVETEWAEVFKDIQITNPDWYSSSSGASFNALAFTTSLGAFSSSFASSTGSSGSSGSGGGGSSGGGGGGGGGGSW